MLFLEGIVLPVTKDNISVVEDPVPEFGALLSNFSKFFEVRRPLRPERKAVKRRVKDQVKEPKIIVSIRNAQNLPVRINKYDEEVSDGWKYGSLL